MCSSQKTFRSFISSSLRCTHSFQYANLVVEKSTKKQRIPSDVSISGGFIFLNNVYFQPAKLGFGRYFSDHMIDIDWDVKEGWIAPKICPFQNFSIHPAAKVLHYAIEIFEGMKAYHGVDGKVKSLHLISAPS